MSEAWEFDKRSVGRETSSPSGDRRRVIVKVREPGYVPPGFTVRSRVDDKLYTAEATEDALLKARHDRRIISVEGTRRLRSD